MTASVTPQGTTMFDAMTYLDRKCNGEQWHLLAREAGMPMGQLRATLEAIGRDRLPTLATGSPGPPIPPGRLGIPNTTVAGL